MGRVRVDRGALTDVHIHLEDYAMYSPYVCRERGVPYGAAHEVGDLDAVVRHLSRDPVDEAGVIFSSEEALDALSSQVPHITLRGWYWLRMPASVPEEERERFPQEWQEQFAAMDERGITRERPALTEEERGHVRSLGPDSRLYGLKLHPVQDNFLFSEENLAPALGLCRELGLAVLFHTDDRPETAHLTHPDLYERVISNNPDITFVIGHGGAFAHPRKVGENNPVARAYWSPDREPFPVEWGICRALDIALRHENAYVDTSVSNNRRKAGIIGSALSRHPELAQSILLGTDFPLGFGASVSGQLAALAEHGGVDEELLADIADNRLPQRAYARHSFKEGDIPGAR